MALLGEFEAAVREADPNREPDTFKLAGELFTVSNRDLTIPMARFAQVARSGIHAEELDGLAAMLDLLEAVVIDDDRDRLLKVATRNGVDAETVMDIVKAVIQAESGKDTRRPSDSSDGPPTGGESSKGSSPFGAVPPILQDPRVQALQPLDQAALSLVG